MNRVFVALFALGCAGCTPGALVAGGGASASGVPPSGHVVAIDVDLTQDPGGATPAGAGGGYKPLVTSVAVGDGVRFTNSDGFNHTASAIAGAAFPSAYPFTSAALTATGTTLSGGFSTGSLAAGASSQTLLADKAGTYLFGCFYHYGTPMRAVVVVH